MPVEQRPARRFSLSTLTIPLAILAAIALILELIPANYYVLTPGDAVPVDPMIHISGRTPPKVRGTLYLTDVRIVYVQHKLEELYWRLQPNVEIDPATTVTGGLSPSQYDKVTLQMMTSSEDTAAAAALSAVPGYHPRLSRFGPVIAGVVPKTPAARVLRPGDQIRTVDGTRVTTAAQVRPLVHRVRPGQSVLLGIYRHGQTRHYDVRTIPATNGKPSKHGKEPLIGVLVQDKVVLPLKVHINPGAISGSSAGLMFSLGVIQYLEHRDLAKGCKVAGTGTMDFSGNVGEIGGAKQKILAARAAGAQYFFVPDVPANLKPALSARGSVTVWPVKTLRQALDRLNRMKPCK